MSREILIVLSFPLVGDSLLISFYRTMRYKPILSRAFIRLVSALANDIFNRFPNSFTNPNRNVRSYLHTFYLQFLPPPSVCADIPVSAGVGQGECRKKYRSAVVRACEWRVWILFLEWP